MLNLYHYCASWNEDGQIKLSAGVVRSPDAVCFQNYGDFVAAVSREVGQESITLTSLTYLGQEVE